MGGRLNAGSTGRIAASKNSIPEMRVFAYKTRPAAFARGPESGNGLREMGRRS